jgi:hypothetical protein
MIRRMSIRTRALTATPLVVIAALAVLAAQTPQGSSWSPTVKRIPTPAAAGSAQPQLAASGRGVILSWVEQQGQKATLKFAERTATGWSVARSVASGSDWFVNWADVPSIIRLTNGTLVAHWLQKSGSDAYAYDVRLSHSKDDGRTWSPSFTPHTDGTRTEHGFASLFQMPGAGLGVIWLDGRDMKPESGRGGHGGPGGHGGAAGAMSVRFATFDAAWKQTAETVVDGRVCECCPSTAAVTADGPIAAFRNRTEDEVRDIYIARFEKGKWTEPKAVSEDGWKIAACPVNGPMLSARNRDVAIAWFTVKEDQGRAFVAFSKDAGRTFGSPIRVDDSGALGRVDVELLADGSAVASWIEFADQRAQFRIRRVEASGAKSPAITVSGLANNRASGYPRIARHGDGLVVAWTESADGQSQVQTAIVRF